MGASKCNYLNGKVRESMVRMSMTMCRMWWLCFDWSRQLRCQLSAVGAAQGVFDKDNSAFPRLSLSSGERAHALNTQNPQRQNAFLFLACAALAD
jgi:hypothetical protein